MNEKNDFQTCLPTPYASNHASNLLELPNGDWLCAYFAGSKEGNPDINIIMSRLTKGETVWSEPQVMSGDPGRSEQNPVLFLDPSGKLWLFYTAQSHGQQTAEVRYRTSQNLGCTWDEIRTLFDKPGSFIRQRVEVLEDGSWILPAYYSLKSKKKNGASYGNDYSVIKHSTDNGLTWDEYEIPQSRGLVHMTVVKAKKDGYVAFFRSRWADFIYKSHSKDGLHWVAPQPTTLPNNNSSIQAINLSNGKIALACNPVYCGRYVENGVLDASFFRWIPPADRTGENIYEQDESERDAVWGTPRSPLTVFCSDDDGETWKWNQKIEDFPDGYDVYADPATNAQGSVNYRFSYPSILESSDNKLHITYTYCRDCIKHVVIDLV